MASMAAPAVSPALSAEDELHWLALLLVPGLGTRRSVALITRLRTPQAVFRASSSELQALGVFPGVAQSIASGCTFEDAVLQQEQLRATATTLIPCTDPRYPDRLRQIYDPPLVLFARGRVELLDRLTVAVVGTRRPTTYGVAAAERLSADLAQAGLTIASGMARGIDTAAHKAALAVDGDTVAVLGCGVDVVYPSENRKLAADLAERGLLVSEFAMGAPPYPQNFPIRNRIVSGLSLGVLVVEGAQYSGSSITAKLALDQNREVFAVPGNITSRASWGPNLLIKQGAKLVQDATDVLAELSPDNQRALLERSVASGATSPQDTQAELPFGPMAAVAQAILAILRPDEATHLDVLLDRMDTHSSSEVIAALFDLELSGRVRQMPGKNFVTLW